MSDTHKASEDFIPYLTNRLTCYFEQVSDYRAAIKQFAAAGFDTDSILVLQGGEGIEKLDPEGDHHGTFARLSRLVQKIMSEHEKHEFEKLEEHMRQGHIVIAVEARDNNVREKAHQIMHDNNGHHITYFSRFYIETIEE